jgi:nitrate reductase alpha subunit
MSISWIRDDVKPEQRSWEQFYRNRWQYDKVVRSTHGVNCTGGCTWNAGPGLSGVGVGTAPL